MTTRKAKRSPRPKKLLAGEITPVGTQRTADRIVERLGALIVRGELEEGEALPSERTLAEQLKASRGTVRQAIHKLADWGLLDVKQGGTTRVASVEGTSAVEVIELRYRIGPVDDRERREWAERRLLQGLGLVVLAEARVDREALRPLAAIADAYAERGAPESELWEVEQKIWTGLAELISNRLYIRELKWWSRVTAHRRDGASPSAMSSSMRASFYRELFRRLIAGDAPARYYLEMTQLLLRSDTAY